MFPPIALENIPHLLVSTTERGSQTTKSLRAAYEEFKRYLTEKNVERPVVVLTDGHSSRFDLDLLKFLVEHEIYMFLTPPDTTGITQLLDQVNKGLHHAYRNSKGELFDSNAKVEREGFMMVLGNMWPTWVSREALVNAGKRVGVGSEGLSVEYMQKDKFEQAALCMSGKSCSIINSSS